MIQGAFCLYIYVKDKYGMTSRILIVNQWLEEIITFNSRIIARVLTLTVVQSESKCFASYVRLRLHIIFVPTVSEERIAQPKENSHYRLKWS